MYYRMLIIWMIGLPLFCGACIEEQEALLFDMACMEAWTHADVIKAITISPAGKAEVLEKIVGLLVNAYGIFNGLHAAKIEPVKTYCKDLRQNTYETLYLIRASINETFDDCSHDLAYSTSLNLIDMMLKKLDILNTLEAPRKICN